MRNELDDMFEEKEDPKFMEWRTSKVPFYDDLTDAEKQELQSDYREASIWKETYSNTFSRALNSDSGIDYSTDIEKSGRMMSVSSERLQHNVDGLVEKYNSTKSR